MLLVLLATALANELPVLPERPVAPSPVAGECAKAVGLDLGRALPDGFLKEDGTPSCASTAVPVSTLAHLVLLEAWGDSVHARYRVDTEYLRWQARQAEAERAWWETQAQKPVPWYQKPGVSFALGTGVAVATIIATAYGLNAVQGLAQEK